MAAPIYNPVIPCVHPIPGGMYPGRMIRVQGSIPPGAQRFAINLQCGPNTDPRDDIALHLNFRFVEMCVVRNHLTAMSWGVEETNGGMPLNRGDSFEALILCEPHAVKIALNGIHFCEFPHRVPFQRISHLTVDGDVMIQFIGFEGAQPPPTQMYMSEPPAYGAYGAPPPAYGAPGYGAPQGYAQGQPQQYMQPQQQRPGMGAGTAVGLGAGALAAGGLAGYAMGGGFGGNSPNREQGMAGPPIAGAAGPDANLGPNMYDGMAGPPIAGAAGPDANLGPNMYDGMAGPPIAGAAGPDANLGPNMYDGMVGPPIDGTAGMVPDANLAPNINDVSPNVNIHNEDVGDNIDDDYLVDEVAIKVDDENVVNDDVVSKVDDENVVNDDVVLKVDDKNVVNDDVVFKVDDKNVVNNDVAVKVDNENVANVNDDQNVVNEIVVDNVDDDYLDHDNDIINGENVANETIGNNADGENFANVDLDDSVANLDMSACTIEGDGGFEGDDDKAQVVDEDGCKLESEEGVVEGVTFPDADTAISFDAGDAGVIVTDGDAGVTVVDEEISDNVIEADNDGAEIIDDATDDVAADEGTVMDSDFGGDDWMD